MLDPQLFADAASKVAAADAAFAAIQAQAPLSRAGQRAGRARGYIAWASQELGLCNRDAPATRIIDGFAVERPAVQPTVRQ